MIRVSFSVAAVALVAGCASTSPAHAFKDTAKLVSSRAGYRIAWDQGGDDDARVQRSVRALLGRELSPGAAIEVALLNNKDLRATYEDLSIAQADLVQAGLLENPVFREGVAFPVAGAAVTGVTFGVSENFLSLFTLAARKRIARSELEAAESRVADAVLRVAYEVERAYYTLEAAQQVAAMRRTILGAADAASDLARRQHEAGNSSELDLATQESLAEQVRTDVVRSEAEVITAREELARLLGAWGPEEFRVPAKLPELPAAEAALGPLESLAVGRRLDLSAAQQRTQTFARALAMAKDFRFLEAPSAGASFERAPEGFSVAGPDLGLALPIFDQKQAAIARLEAEVRAARAKEQALAVDVRAEVRAAKGRLVAARTVVERYAQVVVPLHERMVGLAQEQYNAMLLGAYALLQAKESEVSSYRELIEALRDYWTARAELERATGGALPSPPADEPGSSEVHP